MPFQKGQSGNPKGAPPKNRALTKILEAAGDTKIKHAGKDVSRKQALAQMVWELATTGKTELPDGKALTIAPEDWFGVVKFIYSHIDGAAKTEVDVTTAGQPLTWESVVRANDINQDENDDPFA